MSRAACIRNTLAFCSRFAPLHTPFVLRPVFWRVFGSPVPRMVLGMCLKQPTLDSPSQPTRKKVAVATKEREAAIPRRIPTNVAHESLGDLS